MLMCLSQNVAVLCTMIAKRFSPGPLPNYSRTCMNDMKIPTNDRIAAILALRVTRRMEEPKTLKDILGNGGLVEDRAEVASLNSLYIRARIYQAKIRISHSRRIHRNLFSCFFVFHIVNGPPNWFTWTCALCY